MKGMTLPLLTMLLVGCATPAKQFGTVDAILPDGAERSFVVYENGKAPTAVREALTNIGFTERDDARFRVEVGFSVRPDDLALLSSDDTRSTQILSPASDATISLCRKRAYVLTLAFIDTQSGQVISRSGATMSRCRENLEEMLPHLAQTALPFEG